MSLLARKKSSASIGRKRSNSGSNASSRTSNAKTREEKSAPYKDPRYDEILQLANFFTRDDPHGPKPLSVTEYKQLCSKETTLPSDTLFADDVFDKFCERIQVRNEAKIIADLRPLLVPSAETLILKGEISLEHLVESVDEGWNQTIQITYPRPQPDFSVGFSRTAFTEQQLDKLRPILGDSKTELSFFRATWYMYFPFLTCEVKSGAGGLDIADRQNAHSANIAARATFELFRLAGRENEVNRTILAFSVSHSNMDVRIYGYYPVLQGEQVKYHRTKIGRFDFQTHEHKWKTYRFVKNIYTHWAPGHLVLIRSLIDELPSDILVTALQPSQHTRLSEQVGSSHILAEEPASLADVNLEPLSPNELVAADTPETSVSTQQAIARQNDTLKSIRSTKRSR